jgi:trans-2-enoyl-CoA reductase
MFIALKDYENSKAVGATSFITFVLAVILKALNFIPKQVLYLSIIFVGVGLVWMHFENSSKI